MGNLRATLIAFLAFTIALQICSVHATLRDSTIINWGSQRGRYTGPDSAELIQDRWGGCGINSTTGYMYGSISLDIKLPAGNSAGLVTTFYLFTNTSETHDEIDFEFLGNVTGEPYTIHTNIFTDGYGQREQQFKPWFDPTDGYHTYTIFWNIYAVVWLVDGQAIRVFRNYHDSEINYPDSMPMVTYASFWNADDWATQGGRIKTNWTDGPFTTYLQNYRTDACYCSDKSCVERCSQKNYDNWWTRPEYFKLGEGQNQKMKEIQSTHMIYNYCNDSPRYNGSFPKECSFPQY